MMTVPIAPGSPSPVWDVLVLLWAALVVLVLAWLVVSLRSMGRRVDGAYQLLDDQFAWNSAVTRWIQGVHATHASEPPAKETP